jgi:hypothetical protein
MPIAHAYRQETSGLESAREELERNFLLMR